MKKKVICFVTGRSGGHIFPAFSIAEKVKEFYEEVQIHYIHSGSLLERRLFSEITDSVHEMPVGSIRGQVFFKKLKTLFQIPIVFLKSAYFLFRIKPQVIIGTGGALTGPVLLSAFFFRKRIAIWEGNARLGLSNKVLIPFIDKVFTVFENVPQVPKKKQIHCGYPLRNKIQSASHQNNDPKLFNVFICGGSQGSSFLNQVVSEAVCESDSWRKDIFIFHQCGNSHFSKMQDKYSNLENVEVFGFNPSIENYYNQSHLIFSRAGSGVIAEIASIGKALVLVPLEKSGGGHQLKNAIHLYKQGATELILEKEFSIESFKEMVLRLKNNSQKREELSRQLKKIYPFKDGSYALAKWILKNELEK